MEGGMRHKFPPRFEGPPEYFRGPPGPPGPPGGLMGPPGIFDDAPHPRHRRYDDRRRYKQEFDVDREKERPDRNSRWSTGSPRQDEGSSTAGDDECRENGVKQESVEENVAVKAEGGGTTPLHDEPEEPQAKEEATEEVDVPEVKTEQATLEQ